MPRTAKIYARIQSQKTGSARHLRYLLDGHGTDSSEIEFWTKGIRKRQATQQDLPTTWSKIDQKWRQEKRAGGTVAAHSKVTYMQSLITLPNSISMLETHSLSKQVLRLFPQKHPVTIVFHEYGPSGLPNKHLHIAFSYRKYGYGRVDLQLQQGFERNLKALLRKQYVKYGFKIVENKKETQVKRKPQSLMRSLLQKHGRDRMRNPSFLKSNILPKLKSDLVTCQKRYSEDQSAKNKAYLIAAQQSVAWLRQELLKAQHLHHPQNRKIGVVDNTSPLQDITYPTTSITTRGLTR